LTPDDLRKLARIFEQAQALPSADRRAFLDSECGGDAELSSELSVLFERVEDASRDSILDRAGDTVPHRHGGTTISADLRQVDRRPAGRVVRVNLGETFGPEPTMPLESLVHDRMRRSALIVFVAFAFFFVWDYAFGIPEGLANRLVFAAHALIVVLVGVASLMLFRIQSLPVWSLRATELILIGAASLFFAFYQVREFRAAEWEGLAGPGRLDDVIDLTADSCVLRWFGLLVFYGFVMPNTPRRAAIVLGVLAVFPVLLTFGIGLWEGTLAQFGSVVAEMAAWMGIGWATALYGSLKIRELDSRALQRRRVGPYRLLERLGAGGMGEVYLAEHDLLKRPCAVKLISPQHAGDSRTLRRFELEAQATARLVDPNTVRVFDYGIDTDGTFYYVMELLPGLSLQQLVRQYGPLPPGRAIHFLRQVCSALCEAHERGYIHRDIKPSNLMACKLGATPDVVKLLDFGLVRAEAGQTGPAEPSVRTYFAGTPAYVSPEQASGRARLDARSDIYSLGAVGYFLLAGRPPLEGRTAQELLIAHRERPIAPLDGPEANAPSDLARVIARCLEKDPANRFPDVHRLDQALAACACAAEWTRELAALWWEEYAAHGGVEIVPA
jgi:serine/threonine-protein kinase